VNPLEWEWKKSDEKLMPLLTDLPPAPSEFLRIIIRNCQTDCSNMRCTCKKHDVKCSVACGNCRGSQCTNSEIIENDDDDDNDEDAA